MPKMPSTHNPFADRGKTYDQSRPSATARGYGHRWRKERAAFLAENPLCVMCAEEGRTEAASVVDHIKPHRGDQVLFWDQSNWQAICRQHHDSHKKSLEMGGHGRRFGKGGGG